LEPDLFSFPQTFLLLYFSPNFWGFGGGGFSSVNLTNFCQLLEIFLVFLDITKLRGGGEECDIWSKLKTLIFLGLGKKKKKKKGEENA
jgi:hypothetical protein